MTARKARAVVSQETSITAYKGFNADLTCRGFKFEVGKSYEHSGKVKACNSGFHACKNPLAVFDFYAPGQSRYAEVISSGEIDDPSEDDSKIASAKITIQVELSISDIVARAWNYIWSATDKSVAANHATGDRSAASATDDQSAASATGDQSAASATDDQSAASATGDQSAASATGYQSAASATGDRSAASATGYRSAASATGYQSAASATGYRSAASATGDQSAASATGYQSAASATGDQSAASATGYQSAASATGYQSAASATGDQSAASATGYQSAASATGDQSAASATGYQSAASATGDQSAASATGKYSGAYVTGFYGRVSGVEGSALHLDERLDHYGHDDHGKIIAVWAGIVGQNGIKPDVFYTLKDGVPVEVMP